MKELELQEKAAAEKAKSDKEKGQLSLKLALGSLALMAIGMLGLQLMAHS